MLQRSFTRIIPLSRSCSLCASGSGSNSKHLPVIKLHSSADEAVRPPAHVDVPPSPPQTLTPSRAMTRDSPVDQVVHMYDRHAGVPRPRWRNGVAGHAKPFSSFSRSHESVPARPQSAFFSTQTKIATKSKSKAKVASPVETSSNSSSVSGRMTELLRSRQPLRGLPQPFYVDAEMHRQDVEHVWKRSWLFAGFSCQIPKPGDFFTYELHNDSVIVIRNDTGGLSALFNSCRHRGSMVCQPTDLNARAHRLVCPYHQWSYGRNGDLLHCREMPDDFDKTKHGLHQAYVHELDGLIFVCFRRQPRAGEPALPPHERPLFQFDPAIPLISQQLRAHGLKDAKIAVSESYVVKANWKLVYENNRECYHCAAGHPEYVKANYDLAYIYQTDDKGNVHRAIDPKHPRRKEIEERMAERTKVWSAMGFECTADNNFPGEGWYRASRSPMRKGWLVESIDGRPVSTLMGTLADRDMGSLRIHTLPNFWIHCSSDHAVSARLTPLSPTTTHVRADWLVHKDAVEGKDYTRDKLLPFWKATAEQDWNLCEVNQRGVESSHFSEAVFSETKERGVEKFIQWYSDSMLKSMKSL